MNGFCVACILKQLTFEKVGRIFIISVNNFSRTLWFMFLKFYRFPSSMRQLELNTLLLSSLLLLSSSSMFALKIERK